MRENQWGHPEQKHKPGLLVIPTDGLLLFFLSGKAGRTWPSSVRSAEEVTEQGSVLYP